MNLDTVAGELYAVAPEQFVALRQARAADARRAGDKALATAVGALRRPSVSAWLVNLLVRRDAPEIGELTALAERLRGAQAALAGGELRRLSGQRQRVVAGLLQAARRLAAEHTRPLGASVEEEIRATVEAALVDPGAAAALRAGRLTAALRYSGFGPGPETSLSPAGQGKGAPAERGAGVTRDKGPADRERRAAELAAARAAGQEAHDGVTRTEQAERAGAKAAARAAADVDDLERQLTAAREDAARAAGTWAAAQEEARAAARAAGDAEAHLRRLQEQPPGTQTS